MIITLCDTDIALAKSFATRVIEQKIKEIHYQGDSGAMYKRFLTGTLGEIALEKHLGIKGIADWHISDSKNHNRADLSRIGFRNVGVKTVERGKHPIIPKFPREHQVIMEKLSEHQIRLCGFASISVLEEYQLDALVLDKRLLDRGTKTAFWGFDYLLMFRNLAELKELIEREDKR